MPAEDDQWPRRRRDPNEDPAFVSRQEVEHLVNNLIFKSQQPFREEIERIVERALDAKIARFLDKSEIMELINELSSRRWWNANLPVSENAAKPGAPEEEIKKLVQAMRDLSAEAATSKGRLIRVVAATAPAFTAASVFFGALWWAFNHLSFGLK